MEDHVKNQHFVPQFLLRNFSSGNNKIWSYDKIWKKTENRSIKNVASEEYFYDIFKGEKHGSLEYMLGRAETETSPVISRIIETRSVENLTQDERCLIALFIAMQITRTKAELKKTEDFNREFTDRIKEFAKDANATYDYEEINSREFWLSRFSDTPYYSQFLVNKVWLLFESDNDFYISDNPIAMQNVVNKRPGRGNLGLNSDGIEIYFPLHPSLVLCLCCERQFNITEGQKFICNSGNIENVNSLQVRNSERFVFSSKKNFNLVEDMIRKNQANPTRIYFS